MKALVAIAFVLLAGCTALGQGPTTLAGQWGGKGISLMLEGGLGHLEYDCASGTIDQPIPSADGPFTVEGTHRTGQGGPVRVGQIFRSQRATYTGTHLKDELTLNVKLEDGETLGPFTLTRGAPGQLNRCL
jgi:hypothetical protein